MSNQTGLYTSSLLDMSGVSLTDLNALPDALKDALREVLEENSGSSVFSGFQNFL
ncbi:hypothetical protein [Herbidospora daliensis]|uniref:hypothetical protein n=1 Tax=Herbidospora daliensis TaxID=295585 RepID=UPI000A73E924|nr:hypothetical protein [Herbidospora daliensis]